MAISPVQRLVLFATGLVLLGVTLGLIRRRRLREEYAVLWVLTGLLFVVVAATPHVLFRLAAWLGLDYAILLTFVAFVFLAAIVLHYSSVISRQSDREKRLCQELALLREEVERLKAAAGAGDAPAPDRAEAEPPARPAEGGAS